MTISLILIIIATTTLVYGYNYVSGEHKRDVIRWCLMANGILGFCWNFGYGMMSLCTNYDVCYLWRRLALFGVCFYVLVECVFVRQITGAFPKHFTPLLVILTVLTTINYLLVSSPAVVNFFPYNGRTAYSGNPVFARAFQGMFLSFMMILMVSMALYWWFHITLRREKEIVILLVCSHLSLIIAIIPDTILPTFGHTSIPTSGIGAFICYFFNIFVADKLSAFELSANSMNDFIYKNVENSVLFFNCKGKLVFSNEYALKFFDMKEDEEPTFYELFDITKEDARELFYSPKQSESVKLHTRNTHTTCSVVLSTLRDKYNDPTYTACFVYDLTEEERMYNQVNAMKQQLQIDLEKKTRQMEQLTLQSIATIANTIDAKDEYTKGHSERVAKYSVEIARAMGWKENEVQQLRNTALLHDIGKIGVRDAVLKKADRVTDTEYEELKQHTIIGAEILKDITLIPNLDAGALYHHERYDGKGYPMGIKGKDIPLNARIIGVADAFDAMNTKRVYRAPLPKDVILSELKKNRGTQFDPEVLDVFIDLYEKNLL